MCAIYVQLVHCNNSSKTYMRINYIGTNIKSKYVFLLYLGCQIIDIGFSFFNGMQDEQDLFDK